MEYINYNIYHHFFALIYIMHRILQRTLTRARADHLVGKTCKAYNSRTSGRFHLNNIHMDFTRLDEL
jgi:hypothetical protein